MQMPPIRRRNDVTPNVLVGGSDLPAHPSVDRLPLRKKTTPDGAGFGEGLFSNGEAEEVTANLIGDALRGGRTSLNPELDF